MMIFISYDMRKFFSSEAKLSIVTMALAMKNLICKEVYY